MSSSRAASRSRAKQGGAAAGSAMSDAAGSASLPPSTAAAASPTASCSRPRRAAAADAQIKLMQQMFEAERTPVSSQPSDPTAAVADPAAAAAHPPRLGRPPKAAVVSVKRAATGKRVRIVQSSSSESDGAEEEGEAEESDRGRAQPASTGRSRSSSSAHTRKKARGAARSDSDEGDDLVARPAHREGRKSSAAASASASRRQPQRRGRSARASSSSSSDTNSDSGAEQSKDEEFEQQEGEEEREVEQDTQPIDGELTAAAAAAAAPTLGGSSAASASAPFAIDASPATTSIERMSIMDLLDHSDGESEVGIIKLALQMKDDSLAALLKCRSKVDGSTFLQRLYRVFCAMRTTGFSENRARLMRLIEPQVDFHVATRNHAGQSLLHTLCSEATYTIKHRVKTRRHYLDPDQPKYSEWSEKGNRMTGFTDQLCALLHRHGADFHWPDSSGAIPLLNLIDSCKHGLIDWDLLSSVLFPKTRGRKFKRALPVDINIADGQGNPLITLLFEKRTGVSVQAIVTELCTQRSALATLDLFAPNAAGHCAIDLLADACTKGHRIFWPSDNAIPVPKKDLALPLQLLSAWQTARKPLLRSALDAFLIPDLADICCEYLTGRVLKAGAEMTSEEQQHVFGLSPIRPPPRTTSASKSGFRISKPSCRRAQMEEGGMAM